MDNSIVTQLNQDDPMSRHTTVPKGSRKTFEQADLPLTVSLTMPPLRFETETEEFNLGETTFLALTDMRKNSVVQIECTAEALGYIRAAVLQAARHTPERGRKRAAPIGVPGVRVDKRRCTLWTTCRDPSDAGAMPKRVQRKPLDWDDALQKTAVAQELVASVKDHWPLLDGWFCADGAEDVAVGAAAPNVDDDSADEGVGEPNDDGDHASEESGDEPPGHGDHAANEIGGVALHGELRDGIAGE